MLPENVCFLYKNSGGTLFLISMLLHVLFYWYFQDTVHKSASDSDTCFVGPTKNIEMGVLCSL